MGRPEPAEGFTTFAVAYRGKQMGALTTKLFGNHNVANVLAAAAMASHYGIGWKQIQTAVETFQGVRRRMETVGEACGVLVVDDFAHHPTAIRETLRAARTRFTGRRVWALLEPRSNTLRRNVFEGELVDALANADRVILAEVYRQEKIPEAATMSRISPEPTMDSAAMRSRSRGRISR